MKNNSPIHLMLLSAFKFFNQTINNPFVQSIIDDDDFDYRKPEPQDLSNLPEKGKCYEISTEHDLKIQMVVLEDSIYAIIEFDVDKKAVALVITRRKPKDEGFTYDEIIDSLKPSS